VAKLRELERLVATGETDQMIKKEGLKVKRELVKLDRNLGGIRNLEKLPAAVFVIDTKKEHIAVTEANRLGIPVVAVVDTNCDPDIIDYVIPGNDDAIRASALMCRVIADAVEEGRHLAQKRGARPGTKAEAVAPKPLSPEAQAERDAKQAAARNEAAKQQAAREQRLAEAKAKKAETEGAAPDATESESEPPRVETPAVDAEAAAEEVQESAGG
jgi:small subunit ribosomal protein S2